MSGNSILYLANPLMCKKKNGEMAWKYWLQYFSVSFFFFLITCLLVGEHSVPCSLDLLGILMKSHRGPAFQSGCSKSPALAVCCRLVCLTRIWTKSVLRQSYLQVLEGAEHWSQVVLCPCRQYAFPKSQTLLGNRKRLWRRRHRHTGYVKVGAVNRH